MVRQTCFSPPWPFSNSSSQDTKLREDLYELEGKLGNRYLTHESEDSFWLRQGCKPHPLVKKETARLRHQYANFEVIQEHKTRQTTASNGSVPSVATVSNQAIKTSQPTTTDTAATAAATGEEAETDESRKSYIELDPNDIQNLETHARRIGYTISTV